MSVSSHVKVYTKTPIWNESWVVRNVPSHAKLSVAVKDKDDVTNDNIGKFQVSVTENPISKHIMRDGKERGQFFLEVKLN